MKKVYPWKRLIANWKYYTAPGKPTRDEVKIYKAYLKKALKGVKKPKALVLGSTPELRDLLYEMKIKTTVIDISMEMIKGMKKFMKHPNEKETIVRCNWLNSPLKSGYFDIILGDLILANFKWNKRPKFLREIKRLLKPRGYFLTKTYYVPKDWPHNSTEAILKKFAKLPLNENRHAELLVYFFYNTHDKHKVNTRGVLKALKKYYKNGRFIHPNKKITVILNRMNRLWKPFNKVWSSGTEKEIRKQYQLYFDIVEDKKTAKDHLFGKEFPVWLLRAK